MTLMVEAADHPKWYICIRSQSITSQKTATFSVWYRRWEGRNEGGGGGRAAAATAAVKRKYVAEE
jgi:hypothetical protein